MAEEFKQDPMRIIREIIAEEMDIDPSEITEESSFDEDLEMDKNSIIQVLTAIEMEFGIEYDSSDFSDIRSVADVLRSLDEY
ncbi:MAG: acyl carrier protein [Firmicutes bacterium]|nr:acyl carrier protein [Bacillota bacterium]